MSFETDDDAVEQAGYRLMGQGVYFREVDRYDDRIEIEYETVAPGNGVPHQQIGRMINVFREAVEEGWEPTTIEATVIDAESDRCRGSWRMKEAWLHALEAGELSEVDFSGRVLDTLDEPAV
ncbi:MAG: hypothetical protein QXG03_11175 [Halalkalicoccus sp.]